MSLKAKKNSKTNIIDFIMKKKGMKQADIAESLGVSSAQISKWKRGEEIPQRRNKALIEMADLFGDDPEWCLLTKTQENAEAWIAFFYEYHRYHMDVDLCYLLCDNSDIYVPFILKLFNKIGIEIPDAAPDPDVYNEDGECCERNFSRLVCEYIESFSALVNWTVENIEGEDDVEDDIYEEIMNIEHHIINFAIANVDREILEELEVDFDKMEEIVNQARKNIIDSIKHIVKIRIHNNRPVMADYYNLLNDHPYKLDDDCFSKRRLNNETVETLLPLFERTVITHIKLQTELLEELHLKLDFLLKPEDRERLSKKLKQTPPSMNEILNEEMKESKKAEGSKEVSESKETGESEKIEE